MSASNKVRSNTKVKVKRQSGKKVKYVIAEREKEDCMICLEEKKTLISPKGYSTVKCDHFICKSCWCETGERNPFCPFCRADLKIWMEKELTIVTISKIAFD